MEKTDNEFKKIMHKSIKEIAEVFQNNPYYFLYESDIHCYLYSILNREYGNKIILRIDDEKKIISNAIHSEVNIGTCKSDKINPDFLIYPPDSTVNVSFPKKRKFYFPKETDIPRTIIEVKFNRNANIIATPYKKELYKDINKSKKYDFTNGYLLFFDRSNAINHPQNADFISRILTETRSNNRIEIIYISANNNHENGKILCYSSGSVKKIE